VDRADHLLILGGAGDREYLGEAVADQLGFLAHAAGHDDAAILRDRLADRRQALLLGGVEKAASIDQHHVCARIIGRQRVAVAPELGQDTLGIDQGLRAAERDHADLGRGGELDFHEWRVR
jgi:hypothetical protein